MLTFWPIASCSDQPNRRSAAVLNSWMMPWPSMTIMASGMVSQDRAEVALARAQRFLDLLLLVDIEEDAAEMARGAGFVPDQAGAGADPLPRPDAPATLNDTSKLPPRSETRADRALDRARGRSGSSRDRKRS